MLMLISGTGIEMNESKEKGYALIRKEIHSVLCPVKFKWGSCDSVQRPPAHLRL